MKFLDADIELFHVLSEKILICLRTLFVKTFKYKKYALSKHLLTISLQLRGQIYSYFGFHKYICLYNNQNILSVPVTISSIYIPNRYEKGVEPSLSGLSLSVGLQHYSILQGQRSDCSWIPVCVFVQHLPPRKWGSKCKNPLSNWSNSNVKEIMSWVCPPVNTLRKQ